MCFALWYHHVRIIILLLSNVMLACRLRRVQPELLNIEQTFKNYKARRIYGFSFLTFNDPRVVHVARCAFRVPPPPLSLS